MQQIPTRPRTNSVSALIVATVCILIAGLLVGCSSPKQVTLTVDGKTRTIQTDARTVRDILLDQSVELRPLDKAQPDLWQEIAGGATIVVTRVDEPTESRRIEIPFERRTIRNRALPEGESRLIQPGQNGVDEIVERVTIEDGVEVRRKEVQRRQLRQSVDEIIMVGSTSPLPSVPISGTIAYVSSGNAWMMRNNTAGRRPLTSSGDLDQRVLSLSPDGSRLLFTRGVAEGPPTPLNTLWVISTTLVGATPVDTGIQGAIYAEWLPDNDSFVVSTAERISGAPGWKAHNDLIVHSLTLRRDTRKFVSRSEGAYEWWGASFALSPDGRLVAYGTAEQAGVIDLQSGERRPILVFPVYHTYSEWVWVPSISWSPDGEYMAVSVHGQLEGTPPEDSPVFDLWMVSRNGDVRVRLKPDVGMWAAPAFAPGTGGQLLFGQSRDPRSSRSSLYDLNVVDIDGSNARPVFPASFGGLRLPLVGWSPDSRQLLYVNDGDVFLLDRDSQTSYPLTDDGFSGSPRWAE